jgi:hypothetical protein
MPYEEMKLTRREMVRAEIDSAIDLFVSGDVVSAHVLAFAAKSVLRGVAKAEKIETFDDVIATYVRPEHQKDWWNRVNESYNVFKHADSDPARELERFRPETTTIAIFTATVNYGLVFKQRTFPMTIFYAWFLARHPSFALPALSDAVDSWKNMFDHPEGKPLKEAVAQMSELLLLAKENKDELIARLVPEATKNIEL